MPTNGATEVGLEKMTAWLGDGKWDVIHFNFGLHDAKYSSETTLRATREQYADNLRKLIAEMKATGANAREEAPQKTCKSNTRKGKTCEGRTYEGKNR